MDAAKVWKIRNEMGGNFFFFAASYGVILLG
jgi:hypothetical protein